MDAQRLRPLVDALVWPLLFLDSLPRRFDDDFLKDDLVSVWEALIPIFDKLDDELKLLVVEALEAVARDMGKSEHQEFVRALPDWLGLRHEDSDSAQR